MDTVGEGVPQPRPQGKTTFSETFPRQYSEIWKVRNGRGAGEM